MLNKKNILLISLLFLMSLSIVNAVNFDIPSGYQQISSTTTMTELKNNAGESIIIADGNYMDIYDLIASLGNEYVVSNIKNVEINDKDVKEYTFSSKSSIIYAYSFNHWGHPYNIIISPNNIFWDAESWSNPIYQIISSFK
ncbi:MAG: hypothetical protein BZ138_07495 [Methanosphaera sp. rholeuAM270]|nr:MAG: hypothetical protein BZ138_07495 [Methanosphaera sp. rholeuAM270]